MSEPLDGRSMDVEAANREKLRAVFPECFSDGRLDMDRLRSLCGEYIDDDFEKYEFKWKGKSECLRLAQKRSTATLRPCPAESVHFDTTQNLYLEGDNLEVLKLLQKSYFHKVKVIYIDPPYNTGNHFVYEDNFTDPLARYREITQQTTQSHPETMGRYHTNWLNMMYPRLRLAANLLRDDGAIFITIDDNEVFNLKKVCDEIFGEENFMADVIWQHSIQPKGYLGKFSVHHNHILCYSKSKAFELGSFARTEEDNKAYSNPDNDPNGPWRSGDVRNALYRPNLIYDIISPSGKVIQPCEKGWRWSKETVAKKIQSGEIIFNGDETRIIRKIYLKNLEGRTPETIWFGKEAGTTRDAMNELKELFEKAPFDTPKPVALIKRILHLVKQKDYIVLDFFSGSATTAHAVMQLNAEDGGNRRFILVQLPEKCNEKSEAYKAGYKNICEIGKERIRRAGLRIHSTSDTPPDTGFKVFKLDRSTMKWRDDTPMEDVPVECMEEHVNGLKQSCSEVDRVFEILLKMGYPLTVDANVFEMEGYPVYQVSGGEMLIALQQGMTMASIEAMVAQKPQKIVLAGNCLADNDTKVNALYLLENRGIEWTIV